MEAKSYEVFDIKGNLRNSAEAPSEPATTPPVPEKKIRYSPLVEEGFSPLNRRAASKGDFVDGKGGSIIF